MEHLVEHTKRTRLPLRLLLIPPLSSERDAESGRRLLRRSHLRLLRATLRQDRERTQAQVPLERHRSGPAVLGELREGRQAGAVHP